MLALVFVQSLALRKPTLDAGPYYAYARTGFGEGDSWQAVLDDSILLGLILAGIRQAALASPRTGLSCYSDVTAVDFRLDH